MFVFHARRFPANRADAKGYLGMSHRAMHARGCSSCSQPPAGSLTTPPRACHRCASPRLAQSRLTRPHAEISAGRLAEAAVLSLATADAHTRRIHRAARRDAAQASGAAASGVTPGPRAAPADAPPTGSMNAGSHTAAGARVLGMGNMARERPVQPGGLNTRTRARTERIFQRRRGVSHVTGD